MDEIQTVNHLEQTVHSSPFFRKIVEIDPPLNRIITHPQARLDTFEAKMAARKSSCSILTILRKVSGHLATKPFRHQRNRHQEYNLD